MCDCSIKFRITDTGYLEVSYDKECTWEQIGKVKGDASTQAGPQGPQGPVGPRGAAGTNGTNGVTPYISQSTGNWVVNGVDTGIKAAGSNGTISVEASQDIATVGTPNVTTRTVNNELIIQFHQLKGAPGVAPTITATRDGNQVFFKVDGVTVATLNDGIVYTAGTYMNIGSGNVLNCTIVQATSSALGLVKLGSDTVQTEAAQTPSATSGRTYPVQVDSNGKAVVNVPWQEGAGQTYTAGENIGIENNVIKAKIPKTVNELIYFSLEESENGYNGLYTQQLLYTDGIVVDNDTDLAICKGDQSWAEIDFSMQKVATQYSTELLSCNYYKDGDNQNILQNSDFAIGSIISASNPYWGYNSSRDYITAKFNDSWGSRCAIIYNNIENKHFIHDSLYGYSSNNSQNDAIGISFICFNPTVYTDGETKTYGDATVNESSYSLATTMRLDLGVRGGSTGSIVSFGVQQYKRKPSDNITYLADAYWRNGAANREGTTHAQPYKAFTPAGFRSVGLIGGQSTTINTTPQSSGCVVRGGTLVPNIGGYDGKSTGGTVGFIRCKTQRNGNVYRFIFSETAIFTWTQDYKETIGEQTPSGEAILDLDNYIFKYKTANAADYTSFSVLEFKTMLDDFKNYPTYYGFWQSSTPEGAIYNISFLQGSESDLSNLILDIHNNQVWQYLYSWNLLEGVTPLSLLSGSRLNFNHITRKLWYSTGSSIFQIGTCPKKEASVISLSNSSSELTITYPGANQNKVVNLTSATQGTLNINVAVGLGSVNTNDCKEITLMIKAVSAAQTVTITPATSDPIEVIGLSSISDAIAAGKYMKLTLSFVGNNIVTYKAEYSL